MLSMLISYISMYCQDEEGQGMAEYGLILALVAVVVIGALTTLGTGVMGQLNTVSAELQ